MKAIIKRFVMFIIMIALISGYQPCSNALSDASAQKLNKLGLLSNISSSELNKPMTRLIGLTMLLKALGYSGLDAQRASQSYVFTDFDASNLWGVGWANIGVQISITTGTTNTTFSPNQSMSKKEFITYTLRVLGYGINESWDNCESIALSIGLITSKSDLIDYPFTKVKAADILYNALNLEIKNTKGQTLIQKLVDDGVVLKETAKQFMFPSLDIMDIDSVTPLANSVLDIRLSTKIDVADLSDFTIIDSSGDKVDIKSSQLSSSGKRILLITGEETPYIIHTLTVDENSYEYTSLGKDGISPFVVSVSVINNKQLKLTFNEPMNESVLDVNYYKIEGLTINSIAYKKEIVEDEDGNDEDGEEDNLTTVIINTSVQKSGKYYELTVNKVYDISENKINSNINFAYFNGAQSDDTQPMLLTAEAINDTTVIVTFSEKVDEALSENINNYSIDNLNVLKSERQDDGKTVYLTTSPQTEDIYYKLYVSNVTDVMGNEIDEAYDSKKFLGVKSDKIAPTVLGAAAISSTEVVVSFSEPITDDTATVQTAYACYLDDMVYYPVSVEKSTGNTDGSVWILTMTELQVEEYTLVIAGVKDLAGNILDEDNDTVTFVGVE